MNDQEINYTKEAFLNPYNLAFLIMAMLTAFFLSGNETIFNLILIMAAAAELIFLGTIPRNERYQRLIKSQRAAERSKAPSQKEVFELLSRASQRRYVRLRKLEKDIGMNYRKLNYASQPLVDSHLKKIDGLLDSYLNLLYQRERFEQSLHASSESEVVQSITDLRADMANDPPRVQAIKQRRLRVLEQRLGRFKKGRENNEIIEAQLETIEDVTKYVHEQSLTLRNPEEITFQLDTLLSEVEETQATVEDIEDALAGTDLLADMDTYEPEDPNAASQSDRTRASS